jgi:hypothetical protein
VRRGGVGAAASAAAAGSAGSALAAATSSASRQERIGSVRMATPSEVQPGERGMGHSSMVEGA